MSKISKNIFGDNHIHYADYKGGEGINESTFPQEFFEIVSLFAEDCNYNLKSLYVHHNRLFIEGQSRGERNVLMLRFGNQRLVVANIQFIHQRQGKMTQLYKILKKIRKKYGLKPIMIETCQTKASRCWSIKNGLIPQEQTLSFIEKK